VEEITLKLFIGQKSFVLDAKGFKSGFWDMIFYYE